MRLRLRRLRRVTVAWADEAAEILDELSRVHGRSSLETVCLLVLRARQIDADPEFKPLKSSCDLFGADWQRERFKWAAIAATHEWSGGYTHDYGQPVESYGN